MQKAGLTALVLSVLSVLLALSPFFHTYVPLLAEDELYVEEYILSYRLTVTYYNGGNRTLTLSDYDVSVPLFFSNELQEVELTWSSYPIKGVFMDPDGNRWAILKVPDRELVPRESLSFSVEYRITSRTGEAPDISIEASGMLDQIPGSLKERYCGPAACWQTDFQPLRELAYNLSYGKEKVLDIVASFIRWIYANIRYMSYDMPRYPNETFLSRKGDCDDQANLFITLCRIVGIPAYLQIGCIYMYPLLGRHKVFSGSAWDGHVVYSSVDVGWHGWAVVYVPPWGWLPVDLTASYGLEEDLLNAIRNAIYWAWVTILYREIKTTDYISEAYEAKRYVLENDLYIYEDEEMRLIGRTTAPRPDLTSKLARELIFYMSITVAVIGASAISVAIILSRGAREQEEPPGWEAYRAPNSSYHSW